MLRLFTIAALLTAAPVSAQVRVLIDGKPMDIPAGIMRTVITSPKGTEIVDKPWTKPATPGMATITTTTTYEEDDRGRLLSRRVETRIEPQYIAYAQSNVEHLAPSVTQTSAPHLDTDITAIEEENISPSSPQIMRLKRDGWGGHFVASIKINGVKIKAIIDTGAAYTILTPEAARSAGIMEAERTEPAYGIGGLTSVGVVRLKSLEVGGQQLGRTTVRIGQPGIPYTLLGQTEIIRLGRVIIEDGVLTIIPRGVQMASR